jgi:hypothetical protein
MSGENRMISRLSGALKIIRHATGKKSESEDDEGQWLEQNLPPALPQQQQAMHPTQQQPLMQQLPTQQPPMHQPPLNAGPPMQQPPMQQPPIHSLTAMRRNLRGRGNFCAISAKRPKLNLRLFCFPLHPKCFSQNSADRRCEPGATPGGGRGSA